MEDHIGKHWGQSGGRRREGDLQARAFIVVSMGRIKQGKVSRLRIV